MRRGDFVVLSGSRLGHPPFTMTEQRKPLCGNSIHIQFRRQSIGFGGIIQQIWTRRCGEGGPEICYRKVLRTNVVCPRMLMFSHANGSTNPVLSFKSVELSSEPALHAQLALVYVETRYTLSTTRGKQIKLTFSNELYCVCLRYGLWNSSRAFTNYCYWFLYNKAKIKKKQTNCWVFFFNSVYIYIIKWYLWFITL